MVNKIRVLIGFMALFPQLLMFLIVKRGGGKTFVSLR